MIKKMVFVFVVSLLFCIAIATADTNYQCVSIGLFENVFSGANLTEEIYAPDFRLSNGTSCCGETASMTDTTISNCTIDNSCDPITYDSELEYINNCSVSGSCGDVAYDTELIGNCSGKDCDIGWGNLTSIPADIADGDDVSSVNLADLGLVNTTMFKNTTIVRNHNQSSFVTTNITSGDGNLTYLGGTFFMALLDLAEFDNSLSWITAGISKLDNFFSKTDITNMDLYNGSQVNESIADHNKSIVSYINQQDHSANCSVDGSCDSIHYDSELRVLTNRTDNDIVSAVNNTGYYFNNLTGGNIEGNTSIDSSTFFADVTNDRVGIGTTSPSETLVVNGSIHIADDNDLLYLGNAKDISHTFNGSDYIINGEVGTPNVLFNGLGNVGIGTTEPFDELHISSQGDTSVRIEKAGTANRGLIEFQTGATRKWVLGTADSGDFAGSAGDEFYIGNSHTDSKLWIEQGGNVGIGTTAPSNKLVVGDDIANLADTSLVVGNSDGDVYFHMGDAQTSKGYFKWDYSDNYFSISTANGSYYLNTMAWKDGNVGIGTTAPNKALEVIRTGEGAGAVQLRLGTTDSTYWDIGRDHSTGDFKISDDGLGTALTILQSNGNVGIGTTTPAHKLEVAGSMNISGDLNVSGTITGNMDSDNIMMKYFDESSNRTLTDWFDLTQSAGRAFGGNMTDNGDGSVSVDAGIGFIKITNNPIGETLFFNWSANSSITPASGVKQTVYVDYNNGNPFIKTTGSDIDHTTTISLGSVYYCPLEEKTHKLEGGQPVYNLARLVHKRIRGEGIVRLSGLLIADEGGLNFSISSGVIAAGLNEKTLSDFDNSDGDNFTYWYRNGTGGWNITKNIFEINNSKYDDGSGTLDTLTVNRYGVHWIYYDNDGHCHVVYGQGDYTLAGAQSANPPSSLPCIVADFSFIVGKIVVQQGATSLTEVLSPFTETFTPSAATDHGELAGLLDDDHTQYFELDGTDTMTGNLNLGGYDILGTNKLNITINSSIDLRVNLAFLQNLLDSVYATITNVQSWISSNKTDTETVLRNNIDTNVTDIYSALSNSNDSVKSGLRDNIDTNVSNLIKNSSNITAYYDNGWYLGYNGTAGDGTDTTINNCSVEGSCSLLTYDTELDNKTIIRNHNQSAFVTANITAGDGNLTDIGGSFFMALLDLAEFDNSNSGFITTDTTIGNCSGKDCDIGWGNLTSVPADIADGDDDTTYTADEGNVTLVGTVFHLLKLDLAEFDNSLGWITASVSALDNYWLKTEINAHLLNNITDVNESQTTYTNMKVGAVGANVSTNNASVTTALAAQDECNEITDCVPSAWDADGDIDADEISESKINFVTSCSAGDYYRLTGNDLECTTPIDTTIGNCSGKDCDIGWGNLTSVPADIADGDDDTTYACSDWAACTDDSLWDADKLDGEEGVYYLDDTTIANCSVDSSCGNIHYDSELRPLTNRSDTDITDLCYDTAAEVYSATPHTNATVINNCTTDNSCSLITYDSELEYIGNCSGKDCDIGWGNLTSVPADIADGDDVGTGSENCSADGSCATVTYDSELEYINNCSVEGSCSLLTYDTEILYINNCSVDASCDPITYDNELAYIGNCSGKDCDIGWGNLTSVPANLDTDSTDDLTLASVISLDLVNGSYVNASITDHNKSIVSYINQQDHSANCTVEGSCSLITYDLELEYINNCSVDGSCDDIAYDTEIINNCTVDDSCDPIHYDSELRVLTNRTDDDIRDVTVANITSGDGNLTYLGGTFFMALLDLAEFDNSLSWITASVAALDNFWTKTEVNTHLANNITDVNESQTSYTDYLNSTQQDFIIAQDSAQDDCSEIGGCVENALINGTDANFTTANIHFNLTIGNGTFELGIWNNGSGICIVGC